jgi:hypothetical protein
LEVATFRRVEALLDDPTRKFEARGGVGGNQGVALLTRLLRCGKCDGRFTAFKRGSRKSGERVAIYLCCKPPAGCMNVSVARHLLDPWVMDKAFRYLDSKRLREGLERFPNETRETPSITSMVRALDELALDHYERGLLTATQYETARHKLSRQLDRASAAVNLEVQLPKLTRAAGCGRELRLAWPGMSLDERRAIAGAAIERITLAPVDRSKPWRFQPERVKVKWRI